jgi:predicted dithiol-disulfide oxidoreductase (DUF899 family)
MEAICDQLETNGAMTSTAALMLARLCSRYLTEEFPGISVFYKAEAGEVFHAYSTYARGFDMLLDDHHYLDITPEGRNPSAYPKWARRRDEYDSAASSQS